MGSLLALPSDVAHLIVHFLCGHSVENAQETPCNVPRWATDRNNDTVMGLTCRKIRLRKRLEVLTIMGEQGFVLTDRIRQLLGIVVAELPCFLGCDDAEPARTNQLGNQYVHVFIEIQL